MTVTKVKVIEKLGESFRWLIRVVVSELKDMKMHKFKPLMKRSVQNAPHTVYLLSSFLSLTLLLVCSFGCAPASSPAGNGADSASGDVPELTEETIRERINDTRIRKVPEENGAGEPIGWTFDEEEPKEITVVEKQIQGDRATVILDIKTGSAEGAREPRTLAGQIRTEWQLRTGWVLRRWDIVNTENISMKYKNLPKPAANNSNR